MYFLSFSSVFHSMQSSEVVAVLYTPTACPTDSDRLSLDPAISNGLSRQSIRSSLESVGHDWILLLVQVKSSESPFKPLKSKKWLDWLEFCVRWTSAGLPPDFCWISDGLRQKPVIFAKSSVHWASARLPPDFQWTSKQKRCKRVVSGKCSHSLLLLQNLVQIWLLPMDLAICHMTLQCM